MFGFGGLQDDAMLWGPTGLVAQARAAGIYSQEMAVLADYVEQTYPENYADIIGNFLVDVRGLAPLMARLDSMRAAIVVRAMPFGMSSERIKDTRKLVKPCGLWILSRLMVALQLVEQLNLDARGVYSVFLSHKLPETTPAGYADSVQVEAGMHSGRGWQIKTHSRWGRLGIEPPTVATGVDPAYRLPSLFKFDRDPSRDYLLTFINMKRGGRELYLGDQWQWMHIPAQHPPFGQGGQNPVTAHGWWRIESREG